MADARDYVVHIQDNGANYSIDPVHIRASSPEEACRRGVQEILDHLYGEASTIEGYEAYVVPMSQVKTYLVESTTGFTLREVKRRS